MLSQEQITQFKRDGHLVVEQLIDNRSIAELRIRVETIASGRTTFPEGNIEFEPGTKTPEMHIDNLRKLNDCAKHDPVFMEHAKRSVLLDSVENLIGPDIKLLGDQLFLKPPGGMEKTYHQDSPYFAIRPMELVSSWTALDDVTLENGCLWVAKGGHKGPLRKLFTRKYTTVVIMTGDQNFKKQLTGNHCFPSTSLGKNDHEKDTP